MQIRNLVLLLRIGLRWQHRLNPFEGGVEAGREVHAFGGYRFNTQGNIAECLPSATETFAACVTRLSKLALNPITKNKTGPNKPQTIAAISIHFR
jgi:hypothetical protein